MRNCRVESKHKVFLDAALIKELRRTWKFFAQVTAHKVRIKTQRSNRTSSNFICDKLLLLAIPEWDFWLFAATLPQQFFRIFWLISKWRHSLILRPWRHQISRSKTRPAMDVCLHVYCRLSKAIVFLKTTSFCLQVCEIHDYSNFQRFDLKIASSSGLT